MNNSHRSRFFELWNEIRDFSSLEELLDWDQETMMPARGVEGRARLLATVAAAKHQRLIADELFDLLAELAAAAAPGSVDAAQAREARRAVARSRRIPVDLERVLALTRSRALAAWQEARAKAEFGLFEPHLSRLVELKRQEAACLSNGGPLYDALLDLFEPGATEKTLEPLFTRLRAELTPLVAAAAESGRVVDEAPAQGHFPVALQRELCLEVARAVGFDFEAGRLDPATHPFCVAFHPQDVRMTWRWQEDDIRPGLYGVLHETGHGLYEQGLPSDWFRTPIGDAVSLGIHESQSRLWENHVGRGKAFWRWLWPRFVARFPAQAGGSPEAMWPALHGVQPSLIRVEADEATYNLHIAVRFEIERALFADQIRVSDLPERWNELYRELLGLSPPNDAEGVLQDIHWSMGSFGYFPTYTLGTLAAAQLFAAAERAHPDLEARLEAGDFAPLLAWLRHNVHRHGAFHTPAELLVAATGEELSPEPFLTYLKGIVAEIYGV